MSLKVRRHEIKKKETDNTPQTIWPILNGVLLLLCLNKLNLVQYELRSEKGEGIFAMFSSNLQA